MAISCYFNFLLNLLKFYFQIYYLANILVLGVQRKNNCPSFSLITSSSKHISRLGKHSRYNKLKYHYIIMNYSSFIIQNYTKQSNYRNGQKERINNWF